jgi:acetyltransferase-like isoleucine patch superfamily enzyme
MYLICTLIEKLVIAIRIFLKTCYYKIKYGKRLSIGKKVKFRKRFAINISKNGFVKIGDNCFFNNDCTINAHKEIIIGHNNLFGENVKIYDHNHIFNDKTIDIKKNFIERKISIGNNNWFGTNCTILSKADIDSNNVFSANTCINEKIDSNNIVSCEKKLTKKKINYK